MKCFFSCCETGLFLPDSAIDEPVAVSTGFLCAGARGVVASQWAIYDLSAALLSILYHEQRKAGKNRPVALQAAQQKMRQMTGTKFEENYSEELREHLEAEADRIADIPNYDPKHLTAAEDALEIIDDYTEKDYPFEHPVHWASLGCYGLR
jgi:CHAT domain-containing protein